MDQKYGLPRRLFGDGGLDTEWMTGFNQAVLEHCERNGLPWHSRLSSVGFLSDIQAEFKRRAAEAGRLHRNSAPFKPEGFGFALSLDQSSLGMGVKLESESLFKDPSCREMKLHECRAPGVRVGATLFDLPDTHRAR